MVPARLLMNLMISLAKLVGRCRLAGEEECPRGHLEASGFSRSRLYSTTMRSALSSCRLYSWMRLTWQSKIVSGSTVWPDVVLSHWANWDFASRFALRNDVAKSLVADQFLELCSIG